MINQENIINLTATEKTDVIPKKLEGKQPGKYCVMKNKKVIKVVTYTGTDSPVDQSPQVETDINKLLEPAIARGLLRHAVEFEGEYDDFSVADFQEAQFTVAKAKTSFEKLPSAIRNKFENDPAKFIEFTGDPKNAETLKQWGVLKGNDGVTAKGTPSGAPTETDMNADGIKDKPAPAPTT